WLTSFSSTIILSYISFFGLFMIKRLLLLGSSLFLFVLLAVAFAKNIVPFFSITNPSSAEKGLPSAANSPIIFGSSTALKGSARQLGENMTLGEKVYLDKVNARGGIS